MFLQDPYMLKALEYLLGVLFLILFAGFWQYATGGRTATAADVTVHRRRARIRRARMDIERRFTVHSYARSDLGPRRRGQRHRAAHSMP
jgi:hypothetical protein